MTPYQKIMRAYNDPKGVRGLKLSAEDVMQLGQDDAIRAVANLDDEESCQRQKRHRYDAGGGCTRCGSKKTSALPNVPRVASGYVRSKVSLQDMFPKILADEDRDV